MSPHETGQTKQRKPYIRRLNSTAKESCSLFPFLHHSEVLVKLSPLIEKGLHGHEGRLLQKKLETPEEIEDALKKILWYLNCREVPPSKVQRAPAYYPEPDKGDAIYAVIAHDTSKLLRQLRNQCRRIGLHCYVQDGAAPEPPNQELDPFFFQQVG